MSSSQLPQVPNWKPFIPEGFGTPGYVVHNIGPHVIGAQIGLSVVMLFVIGLRIYTRACITRAFGWDDWTIMAASVLVIGQVVCHGLWVRDHGFGYHIVDAMTRFPNDLETAHKIGYIAGLLHCVAMFLVKLSIIIFMYRLISLRKTRTRYALHAMTGIIVVFSIVWLFFMIFKCNPPNRFWLDRVYNETGQCNPQYIAHAIMPALAGVTDLMVWAVPIPALMRLQMERREKIAVVVLFTIGSGSFVASFVRAALYREDAVLYDATWTLARISLLASTEALLALICSSLYTIKPFIERHSAFFGSLTSSRGSRGSNNSSGGHSSDSASDSYRNLKKLRSNGSSEGKLKIYTAKRVEVTRDEEHGEKEAV